MFHNLAHILSYNCCKYRVDTPPLPRDMQIGAKCISPILSHTLTVVVQWPKFDFHNLARICVENIGLTRPLSHEICKVVLSVYSPILSHTLTVVVQWPKFGHSTTLNNKGYKPHREMRHVS